MSDLDGARGLTVRQPWASLIEIGAKRYETRSWKTKYRGPVLIHAGGSMPCRIGQTLDLDGVVNVERGSRNGLLLRGDRLSWPYRLPLSCVVAVADLVDVLPTFGVVMDVRVHRDEFALGDFTFGRWAWQLDNVRRLPTFRKPPARGALGLWRPDPGLIEAVHGALESAA